MMMTRRGPAVRRCRYFRGADELDAEVIRPIGEFQIVSRSGDAVEAQPHNFELATPASAMQFIEPGRFALVPLMRRCTHERSRNGVGRHLAEVVELGFGMWSRVETLI